MEVFDKVGKKISEVGQGIVKSTKDLADISRLGSQIASEEKLIEQAYYQIGQLFYETARKDHPGLFTELCDSITASSGKIAEFKEEIERIKGFSMCPDCGAKVSFEARFCSNCGLANKNTVTDDGSPQAPESDADSSGGCPPGQ